MTPVDYGARVVLRYRLSLADGTLVDASEEGDPLVLTVGDVGEQVQHITPFQLVEAPEDGSLGVFGIIQEHHAVFLDKPTNVYAFHPTEDVPHDLLV